MGSDGHLPESSQTSLTLIQRLKNREEEAWSYFESFYGPIILRFAISRGLTSDQAEEVRSACYEAVVKQIGALEYDREKGRFRNWLLTIAARRASDLKRQKSGVQADTQTLDAIETQDEDIEAVWEKQWQQQILLEAYRRVELRMNSSSQAIFQKLVREAQPVKAIADEFGISENQIYKTKQRSLQMLREEVQFLESDPLTAG